MKVLKSFIFSFLLAISAFALDLSNVHTWIIPDGEVGRLEIDGDEVWHRPARTIFYFSNSQPVITNIIGSIGAKYRGNTNLVSVEIGELATDIDNYAFNTCKGLTNIVIPDNIKTVGANVFYGDTGLTNIVFGSGVTNIGTTVFSACTNLQNVTILGQIPAINNWAFQNCSALSNITFPDSVQSIGNQSFYNCKSLTNFDLPPHLKNLGTQTFTHCESLTSISVPDSIEEIGTYTFYHCYGLTNISLPNHLTNLPNGMFAFCTNLLSITFPQSLISIGHYTLQSCLNIQSVVLPDSVESIGNNSFENEKKLSAFTFGLNINSIGTNAFRSCSALNTFNYYKYEDENVSEAEARIKNLVSGSGYNTTGKDFVCLNPGTIPYVTNGLVAYWDAIWNAGIGEHSNSTNVWKDLVGSRDATLYDDYSWTSNSWVVHSVSNRGIASAVGGQFPKSQTWQILIKPDDFDTGGRLIAGPIQVRLMKRSNVSWFGGYGVSPNVAVDGYDALQVHQHTITHEEDSPIVKYWIDGECVYTNTSATANSDSSTALYFANRSQRDVGLDGEYYAIRLYDRVLTDEEIAHNAAMDRIRFNIE